MPFTSESAKAAGSRGLAVRKKNRTTNGGGVAVADPPVMPGGEAGEVLPAQSDILAGLLALAGGLEDKQRQEAAVTELGRLLERIDFRAYPDLAKNEAVQKLVEQVADAAPGPTDLPPGSPIGKDMTAIKKDWTWRDVMANPAADPALEYVEWEPRFNDVIVWNGLRIRVTDGDVIRTPRVFKDIHDEARRGMRTAQEHAEWMMRKRNSLSDPTVLGKADDLQGQKVRGFIQSGVFEPGGGMRMLPPDEETYKMAASHDEAEGGGEGEGGAEGE